MQRLHERQMRKAHEGKEKVRICSQTYHLGASKLMRLSQANDPRTWDMPDVYPKKRKKRKKEFPHGTAIRCKAPVKD